MAVGVIGLSLRDFYSLAPDEFIAIVDKYNETGAAARQERWEQIRKICYFAVSPYLKKGKDERSIMRFPWEVKHSADTPGKREPDREEKMKRKYGGRL